MAKAIHGWKGFSGLEIGWVEVSSGLSRFGYRRLDYNLTDALDAPYEPYADMFLLHMFTT